MSNTQNNQKPPHLLEHGVSGSLYFAIEVLEVEYEHAKSGFKDAKRSFEDYFHPHLRAEKEFYLDRAISLLSAIRVLRFNLR